MNVCISGCTGACVGVYQLVYMHQGVSDGSVGVCACVSSIPVSQQMHCKCLNIPELRQTINTYCTLNNEHSRWMPKKPSRGEEQTRPRKDHTKDKNRELRVRAITPNLLPVCAPPAILRIPLLTAAAPAADLRRQPALPWQFQR